MMRIEKFVEKTIDARSGWIGFRQELKCLIQDFDREYDLDLKYSAYQEALYELIQRIKKNDRIDFSLLDNRSLLESGIALRFMLVRGGMK